jgi:hypothetical protein
MPRLLIYAGLPGSGKSHHVSRLPQTEGIRSDRIWDDYHAESRDDTHAIDQSRHFSDVLKSLRAGDTCAVMDVWFCTPGHVELASDFFQQLVPDLVVDVRYFANDPEACALNAVSAGRSDTADRLRLIESLAQRYSPPDGARLIPVYRRPKADRAEDPSTLHDHVDSSDATRGSENR